MVMKYDQLKERGYLGAAWAGGTWKKEYTINIEGQPYHVMFVHCPDEYMELSLYARPEVSVQVKPEDVNADMGPFAFQLEPYARVLCARLELEK